MARKFSEAMGKRISKLTSDLFNQSVCEVMRLPKNTPASEIRMMADQIRMSIIMADIYEPEEMNELILSKEKIDNLYLQKVLKLTSRQLEDIITTHNADFLRRAPLTIEAIISELTRRSLLGDSSRVSDTKSKSR